MKTNSEIICETELISRYVDNELDSDELVRLKAHISDCDSCRKRLDDYGRIGSGLNSLIQLYQDTATRDLEDKVVESVRRKSNVGFRVWKDVILSKKMLVPVGLVASVIMMFMIFFHNPSPVGPTAIVSSLSGSGSSVVILETTGTRQTIIWFGDNG